MTQFKRGDLVRFANEQKGGPVHRVVSVMHDGMIEIHDMGGYFAPHLFAAADDIGGIPEVGRTETNALLCCWTMDDSAEFWETSCGHSFALNDGTPRENGIKFCCYCGDKLIERTEPDPDILREDRDERRRT